MNEAAWPAEPTFSIPMLLMGALCPTCTIKKEFPLLLEAQRFFCELAIQYALVVSGTPRVVQKDTNNNVQRFISAWCAMTS